MKPLERKFVLEIVVSAAFLVFFGSGFAAETGQPPIAPGKPSVIHPVKNDVSPALRNIPPIPSSAGPVEREIPKFPLPRTQDPNLAGRKVPAADPLVHGLFPAVNMPSPLLSFDGVNNVNGVLPPDTNGDVGPNHYVQMVNISFAIWDKSGALLYGPANNSTLWTGFGGVCEANNDGDPIALYDPLADRWLMSQFALPNYPAGPFYQCIAISQTGDPTGAWYRYQFVASNTKLNDYPKFGVWPDGYYMTVNQFNQNTFTWGGVGVFAFERDKMLAGLPAQMIYFDLFSVDPNLGGMLPSDLDGPTPPPAGAPNTVVQVDDNGLGYPADQLELWKFHVDWTTPAASTFTGPTLLPTAAFDSNMCGYLRNCIPQLGTTGKLDAISDRLMYRLAYRNFGTHESLVLNHTVDVDGTNHAGIRWYEVRDPGGVPIVYQQGTVAPDTSHRWMGSLAMDGSGNIALGYSVSSSTTFPSVRYTGRLAGDPLGTMPQGESVLIAGAGSQTSSTSRWGDYSMMAVDPTDDCTFWYTQEYYSATSSSSWRTRVGSFKFASCAGGGTGTDLAVTKTDTPDPVTVGNDLTYTVTVTNLGPDAATGVTLTDTLPAGVTYGSATPSQGACLEAGGVVTCGLGDLANGAVATVTIVVTPTATGAPTNTAAVTGNETDPNPGNNSAMATTTVNGTNTPPAVGALNQRIYDGLCQGNEASVAEGGSITTTSICLEGNVGDADLLQTVQLQVEARPSGTAFTGSATAASVMGSQGVKVITIGGLTVGTAYHWRARGVDDQGSAGAWMEFGTAGNTDFSVTSLTADLSVVKTDSPDPVTIFTDLTYMITVTNNGPASATGVTVTDRLPLGATFVLSSTTQGSCSGTFRITCSLGTMANGGTATVRIVVRPTATGTLRNTATVSSTTTDPNTANNRSTARTTVQ